MRARTRAIAATAVTTLALLTAAACQSNTPAPPGNNTSVGAGGGAITIFGCTPKEALIPGNTNEVCGGNVLDAVTSRLVHYNSDTAAPELDIAQSIDSPDNKVFTVKLKPGYKFQDGTEVLAKNFVDAWNWVADGKNGQKNSYFMGPIAGFNDVQCGSAADGTADCKGKPAKTDKMSGLKVVDDHTFTITTTESVSNLQVRLGYTAYAPLPDTFFTDPAAYGKKPIGSGPFSFVSQSDTDIVIQKFADYSGSAKANVDKVDFKIYQDVSTAYNDVVANNLDWSNVPADQMANDQFKSDLPDRNSSRAGGSTLWITFSPVDAQLKSNVPLRRAISEAVDRETIIKAVFNGAAVPSDGWVPKGIDGYKPDVCGDSCKFNASKAKADFTAAGGYKGTLHMTVNGDGPANKAYGDAICNSIKSSLGIACVNDVLVDFSTFQKKINANQLQGIFRSGWQMDYPSIENFLAPIYSKGADSNWSKYDSAAFATLLKEGAAAKTTEEANAKYQAAETQLSKDFPTAPLWSAATVVGWSDKVTDVKTTAFGTLDLSSIKLK